MKEIYCNVFKRKGFKMIALYIDFQDSYAEITIRNFNNHRMYLKRYNDNSIKMKTMNDIIGIARKFNVDEIWLDIIGFSGYAYNVLQAETNIRDKWYNKILNFECEII